MRRVLFNLVAFLSLLLCTTTAVLWVRTYHSPDDIEFSYRGVRWHAGSHHGRLQVDNVPQQHLERRQHRWEQNILNAELEAEMKQMVNDRRLVYGPPDPRPDPRAEQWALQELMPQLQAKFNEGNARRARLAQKQTAGQTAPVKRRIPHAVVVPALAILPAAWLTTRGVALTRYHRRKRRGWCPACGYNLTGNVSGVCPECGRRA